MAEYIQYGLTAFSIIAVVLLVYAVVSNEIMRRQREREEDARIERDAESRRQARLEKGSP